MRTYHITPLPIAEPEDIITYNTSATSCPRVPSSKLSGIIALSTQWRRYYSIIIHSGSDWKGCNVIRAHDTI